MGKERIDEEPIKMQPLATVKPDDVREELDRGSPNFPVEAAFPEVPRPTQ